jgi:hypothetical protein
MAKTDEERRNRQEYTDFASVPPNNLPAVRGFEEAEIPVTRLFRADDPETLSGALREPPIRDTREQEPMPRRGRRGRLTIFHLG